MEITNYKLKNFLKQKQDIVDAQVRILGYIKPHVAKTNIFNLTLRQVIFIKKKFSSGKESDLLSIVAMFEKIEKEDVKELRVIRFFGIVAYVRAQLELLYNAEENGLNDNIPNHKWDMVEGSKRMEKHGANNTLELLTKGDRYKDDLYLDMRYVKVFGILKLRRDRRVNDYKMSLIKDLPNV